MTAEKFNKLKKMTDDYKHKLSVNRKRLTKHGKKLYPFLKLKEIGINNITTFKKELKAVKSKKSMRSYSERQSILVAEILLKHDEDVISFNDILKSK